MKFLFTNFFRKKALEKNSSLKQIKLTECKLTSHDLSYLSKGLAKSENVNIIDLSKNLFDEKSGGLLGSIISEQGQRKNEIVWLHGLRGERPEDDFYKKGLCEVIFSDNLLGDEGSKNLVKLLKFDNWLKSLDLKNNGIGVDGVVSFIQVLKQNESLLSLDLRDNKGLNRKASQVILNCLTKNMIKFKSNLKSQLSQVMEPKSQIFDSKEEIVFDLFSNKSPKGKKKILSSSKLKSKKRLKKKFSTSKQIQSKKIMEEVEEICPRCRDLESKLMKAESEIINLKLEISKLKEENEQPQHNTISLNNGYSTFNLHNISRNIDEIRNTPAEVIQQDTPQFISKIEILMNELTRIMDNLEPGNNQNNNTVLAMDHLSNTSSNYYNNTINYDQNNQGDSTNQITFDLNEEDLGLERPEEQEDLDRTVSHEGERGDFFIVQEDDEEDVVEGDILEDSDDTYNPYKDN